MPLDPLSVRPILKHEESHYVQLMEEHHYLGAIPKIGEILWYVAAYTAHWVALIFFTTAALKCAARDHWIGWRYRHQTWRLKLLAIHSRFLILPPRRDRNLDSRILSLCLNRLFA